MRDRGGAGEGGPGGIVRKGESWKSLEALPDGSVVGTSSVRRVAPLERLFPSSSSRTW
ncbi:hypothetical protein C8Q76DRAFT_713776, partial [Earliella scabrosa]